VNVLLVNMPFGAVRPAIGPSLLKAHLEAMGCEMRIAYLNLRFAQRLGGNDFTYIADRAPTQSLAGDWVFAPGIVGRRDETDRAYLEAFRERFGSFSSCDGPLAILERARALAEPFLDECLSDIPWPDYDVVGFTSTFTQHVASLALARRVKERYPGHVIVFGGANCEDEMGLTLHRMFPFVDYVCSGEADVSFPLLIAALRDGTDPSTIAGVVSRRDGESVCTTLAPKRVKDLDTLPYPNYDDYFEQLSAQNGTARGILMESSRGCWWGQKHHCTFCGLNGTTMAYRSKSADRVLDELTEQIRRYRPNHVEMVDNILDMHYFRDLLPELKRRRLRLGLFYETKANLTKAQVRELRDAGVTSIQPGIESFSTEVLRIMRKGTTGMQNIQLLKWCKELGIKAYWNLLYGFPGEDPDDYRAMVDVVDSITHLEPPQGMGAIRLDRFSPNYISASELGLCDVRPDRSYTYIYDRPEDELAGLAYYFEHDYVDGRDPRTYVVELEDAIRRWYEEFGGRGLTSVDHGERLAIWDFRGAAVKRLTILEGDERALYLECDDQRAPKTLFAWGRDRGMSETAVTEALDRFTAARLMIALDGRYLSLAVSTPAHAADQPAEAAPVLAF
jgi:ribosomal peptide maturation radical SAM protein 1